MNDEDSLEPIWHHIAALRSTLLRMLGIIGIGFAISFAFYDSILSFLESPLQSIYPKPASLVLLGPLDGFLITLKACFWISLVATAPLWILVLMQFIVPGLKSNEKRLAAAFVACSLAFIAMGLAFAFFVTIPLANQYLFSFNESIGTNLWSLEHYLDYTLFLLLANGLAFQMGAIGVFAVQLGFVSAKALASKRKHTIVAAFIIGALLTPPDILTQFLLAVPLIGLYEGLILYARFLDQGLGTRTWTRSFLSRSSK